MPCRICSFLPFAHHAICQFALLSFMLSHLSFYLQNAALFNDSMKQLEEVLDSNVAGNGMKIVVDDYTVLDELSVGEEDENVDTHGDLDDLAFTDHDGNATVSTHAVSVCPSFHGTGNILSRARCISGCRKMTNSRSLLPLKVARLTILVPTTLSSNRRQARSRLRKKKARTTTLFILRCFPSPLMPETKRWVSSISCSSCAIRAILSPLEFPNINRPPPWKSRSTNS